MRICVFQSLYTEDHTLREHDPYADPSKFTDQHVFEHVWVKKATAKEQIDAAVAKGYDFYFNFMWGQWEDEVAGVEACKYIEHLNLPSIGQKSWVLERTKNDLYDEARRRGSPLVPGHAKYPFFVKPANACASLFINERSVCRDRSELIASLESINNALAPGRSLAGSSSRSLTTREVDGIVIPEDIVVQEYIEGWDHSVVIVEFGNLPVALTPERYVYPKDFRPYIDFLTFSAKFNPETHVEPLRYEDDPEIFGKLQTTAVAAWRANKMAGNSWANVDIRVTAGGDAVVMEVNPMPAVFFPPEHEWEDVTIRASFPGGHRALINTLIASHQINQTPQTVVQKNVSNRYDQFSNDYDGLKRQNLVFTDTILDELFPQMPFSGTILDLACGTGFFGQYLVDRERQRQNGNAATNGQSVPSVITGTDLSPGMIEKCLAKGIYSSVTQGTIQSTIQTAEPVDHIVCINSLLFLHPIELSMVLSRIFQLARKSVTFTIEEVPQSYNDMLIQMGPPHCHMVVNDLKSEVEAYGVPVGWDMAGRVRKLGWTSPHTGINVLSTGYHFVRNSSRPA